MSVAPEAAPSVAVRRATGLMSVARYGAAQPQAPKPDGRDVRMLFDRFRPAGLNVFGRNLAISGAFWRRYKWAGEGIRRKSIPEPGAPAAFPPRCLLVYLTLWCVQRLGTPAGRLVWSTRIFGTQTNRAVSPKGSQLIRRSKCFLSECQHTDTLRHRRTSWHGRV